MNAREKQKAEHEIFRQKSQMRIDVMTSRDERGILIYSWTDGNGCRQGCSEKVWQAHRAMDFYLVRVAK